MYCFVKLYDCFSYFGIWLLIELSTYPTSLPFQILILESSMCWKIIIIVGLLYLIGFDPMWQLLRFINAL